MQLTAAMHTARDACTGITVLAATRQTAAGSRYASCELHATVMKTMLAGSTCQILKAA